MAIDIRVFPTSGRLTDDSDIDLGTNLVTEYNLASIVNQLLGEDGFIITKKYNGNNPFEFNIKGYYFEIKQAKDMIPENLNDGATIQGDYVKFIYSDLNKDLTAHIKIDTSNLISYHSLLPTTEWSEEDGNYTLKVLENLDSTPSIPLNSRIHFNTYIDDGSLD